MKSKKKTPLFSAIVLRVVEIRFEEIVRVKLTSETVFELVIKGRTDTEKFLLDFDGYMVHLVSEFAEPEQRYSFRIFRGAKLRAELIYNDLNNINFSTVNLYPKQQQQN